jgi:hypothetical protein
LRQTGIHCRFPAAEEEDKMKHVAALVALCALSQSAVAQTPECKSITDATARLACYDKPSAPPASSARRVAPVSKADTKDTKYVDPISQEDARMNAQLKNICRGC